VSDRLTAWSYRRQLLDRAGGALLDALKSVVGVYSTHPTAPLALLARTDHTQPGEFRGLEQQRDVVRIVGMRGSAFLVPREFAATILAATRQSIDKLAGRLRYGELDLDTYTRLVPKVLECCATPRTPSEIRDCVGAPEDTYFVARVLAREGKVLRVGASLRTDQLKYVATQAWLGHPFQEVDPTEALAWLAHEYLRAFGPVRVVDFAWWAGVPRRAATLALSKSRTVERGGLLLLEEDVDAFDHPEPIAAQSLAVLPKWDSLTMGYAPDGRQRFIDDRYLSLAYTSVAGSPGATSGDGLPLILRGGRAIATWSHRFAGNKLTIAVQPFESATQVDHTEFERIGELLSASSLEVTPALLDPR
jgi:hypothetical protein